MGGVVYHGYLVKDQRDERVKPLSPLHGVLFILIGMEGGGGGDYLLAHIL